MPLISASVDAFIITALVTSASLVFLLRRQHPNTNNAPLRQPLNVLLLFHTLFIIYTMTVQWPPNIFDRLKIPLTMPSDTIRKVLLQQAGLDSGASLPKALETLLTRLSSFEMRTLYVRFGQTVLQDCEYCSTFDEYALYALPWTLLGYIREAALIGTLTIQGSGRERWRTYGIAAIVVTAVVEGYQVLTSTINIPRDGKNVSMLHDNLWFYRHLIFLIGPILIHFLPTTPPTSDPIVLLQTVRTTLGFTSTRLTSLKYLRGAVMRDPGMRESANQWWARQKVEGQWIREDENVQRVASKLGFGYMGSEENAKLRTNARSTVGAITQGLGIAPSM